MSKAIWRSILTVTPAKKGSAKAERDVASIRQRIENAGKGPAFWSRQELDRLALSLVCDKFLTSDEKISLFETLEEAEKEGIQRCRQ